MKIPKAQIQGPSPRIARRVKTPAMLPPNTLAVPSVREKRYLLIWKFIKKYFSTSKSSEEDSAYFGSAGSNLSPNSSSEVIVNGSPEVAPANSPNDDSGINSDATYTTASSASSSHFGGLSSPYQVGVVKEGVTILPVLGQNIFQKE